MYIPLASHCGTSEDKNECIYMCISPINTTHICAKEDVVFQDGEYSWAITCLV